MLDIQLDVSAVVRGIKAAEKHLRENIPEALALGADLVVVEAKHNHGYKDNLARPTTSGREGLTESIAVDGVTGSFGSDLEAIVAAGAAHGIFVEEDTVAHKIKPKHRKALRWPVAGGFAFSRKGVNHPGTTGTHFLANALEAKLPEIVDVLESAVDAAFAEAGFEVK